MTAYLVELLIIACLGYAIMVICWKAADIAMAEGETHGRQEDPCRQVEGEARHQGHIPVASEGHGPQEEGRPAEGHPVH